LKPIVNKEVPGGRLSPGLRFSRKNHGKAHNTFIRYEHNRRHDKCLQRHTPNATRKGNDNAESLGIILGTVTRLEAFQYADHYRKDNYFTSGADSE